MRWTHSSQTNSFTIDPILMHNRIFIALALLIASQPAWAAPARPRGSDRSVSLDVPKELANQRLAQWGFVDVTAAPFQADPTGQKDSTRALQEAIVFASQHQMVCFFPPGKYRVSDTLLCEHARYNPQTKSFRPGRDWPCVLVGSRQGQERPTIVLAPGSPGFDNPAKPKFVLNFFSRDMENPERAEDNINMNQILVGIDVQIGQDNPGAIGVRHRAAQGSSVQDCTIDATHGLAGLSGGAGSGGSHFNVMIVGGKIGADLREAQPAPTIAGFTFLNQRETAILYNGRQTLTAVGCRITGGGKGPAIVAGLPERPFPNGQVSLVDSSIEFTQAGDKVAIQAGSNVYLNNVFVRGAKTLVAPREGKGVHVDSKDWTHVKELAHGDRPKPFRSKGSKPFQYESPIYIDGQRQQADVFDLAHADAPPKDMQSRHIWDEKTFPHWEMPQAVNVKNAPYSAKGDGETDDWPAIQKAIDENEIVFLPKGYYALSRTLKLRSSTRVIGIHRCFAWLIPMKSAGGDFNDDSKPAPLVQTPDDPKATTILAHCGLQVPWTIPASYCLLWQSGKDSLYREVNVERKVWATSARIGGVPMNRPLVVISGNGGGRWYNFHQESWHLQGKDYRHLLVSGTTQPLAFYQCNPEHARSEANLEIRSAKFVSLYGVKGEYSRPIILVRDSDHVRIFGYGGNAAPAPGGSLFVIERTPNFLCANLVDSPRLTGNGTPEHFAGEGLDPDRWSMLNEHTPDGKTIQTRPLDRPVLYRRGNPMAR